MQTRRKSLNLGDLGVVGPKRSRNSQSSHPSPPETLVEGEEPPVKKSKRSHRASNSISSTSPPPTGLMSPPTTTVIRIKDEKPKRAAELSPPPSPVAEGATTTNTTIDTEGINDDIVIGTIQQIEKTGNRPHLVKELAAVLATKLHSVEKSANPSALISSRLTSYLHRSWPAISPCPLAKDLSPVHPRRLYFYLTTTPHQPIPAHPEPIPQVHRMISPSQSSASEINEEDRFTRNRHALSPSPEVDLSSPELDEDTGAEPRTPGGSFSARSSRERSSYMHPRRAASPPLELEERDFKQTASALYEKRRNSQQSQKDVEMNESDASAGADDTSSVTMSIEPEETEESAALKDSAAAVALFSTSLPSATPLQFSSPMLRPQNDHSTRHEERMTLDVSGKDHHINHNGITFAWDSLQSPEAIDLEELDEMFDAY